MRTRILRPAWRLSVVASLGIFAGIASPQDPLPPKKNDPGVEELPAPRPADPKGPLALQPGAWVGPDGNHWMFDGLRWKVLWENGKWYPVIPPGPLPAWKKVDFGMGWTGVLPPNTSIWHVVPPSYALMPPPSALPPVPPPAHRRTVYSSYRAPRGRR